MALRIGQSDKFERLYFAKFREIGSQFGEFVEYERDRAGRDIGLHFVSQKSDGGEIVDPSLVWFQIKGLQTKTLSVEEFETLEHLSVRLDIQHLRFWYIAPEPTYLALYIESKDTFFVLNIQKYIGDKFGDEILTLRQKSLTVHMSKESVLDAQAFFLIKRDRSIVSWESRIAEGSEFAHVFFRDAELILRVYSATERSVAIQLILTKYGSKMRSEAHFLEVSVNDNGKPELIREHWEYMMPDDLSETFPYLEFEPWDGSDYDEDTLFFDNVDESEWPPLELPNGKQVIGDGVFEMGEYKMSVTLNDVGMAWVQTLHVMEKAGFVELGNLQPTMVSVAPWHARDV